MKEHIPLWESWLEEAVRGLRAHPDCDLVRQELLDHLEDRTEGLRRAFPDLSREEAERLALERMGGAESLSRDLAQAHSRWLGGLYQFSNLLLVLVTPLVALESVVVLWRWILPLTIPGWPF